MASDSQNVTNPFDLFAVEEAIRAKEKHGGEVTAVTLGPEAQKRYRIIVGDAAEVAREMRHGLDVVRRIIDGARAHLAPDGVLICEVGMSAPALLTAYPAIPFLWPEFEQGGEGVFVVSAPDLAGALGLT